MVMVKTSDDALFNVPLEILQFSTFISDLVSDVEPQEVEDGEPFDLKFIDSSTFLTIEKWCKHKLQMKDSGKSDKDDAEWERDFLQQRFNDLFKLAEAANYLGVESLLEAGTQFIAKSIMDLNVVRIKRVFSNFEL